MANGNPENIKIPPRKNKIVNDLASALEAESNSEII